MNIKLHTPKSLKSGSGMASLKQFVLSIFATTVSIALTFGTAAIIDYNKKQKEKREIVMMVMYDMNNSLEQVERSDSMIREAMHLQLKLAQDTMTFDSLRPKLGLQMQRMNYTETTERIFSSSIESINTVGNALFIENAANFYQLRNEYKEQVRDSMINEAIRRDIFSSAKVMVDFDFFIYAFISTYVLKEMRKLLAESQQMMDVSDEQLEAYRKQREQLKASVSDKAYDNDSLIKNLYQLQDQIKAAKEKWK